MASKLSNSLQSILPVGLVGGFHGETYIQCDRFLKCTQTFCRSRLQNYEIAQQKWLTYLRPFRLDFAYHGLVCQTLSDRGCPLTLILRAVSTACWSVGTAIEAADRQSILPANSNVILRAFRIVVAAFAWINRWLGSITHCNTVLDSPIDP